VHFPDAVVAMNGDLHAPWVGIHADDVRCPDAGVAMNGDLHAL
jgi:hypothetical protein